MTNTPSQVQQQIANNSKKASTLIESITPSSIGALAISDNLSDLNNVSIAQSNLGLGTGAIQNSNAVNITGGTASISNLSVINTIIGSINGNAVTVSSIGGLITGGNNISISGVGTSISPYSIAGNAGTITSVSFVSANGFSGGIGNPTTTPAITLGTTITGILHGNGSSISAISTTGSGAAVLSTSAALVTPSIGSASALSIYFGGSTLSVYQEGSWTPSGDGVVYTINTPSTYTRIGRLVFATFDISFPSTVSTNAAYISGLPYTVGASGGVSIAYTTYATPISLSANAGGTTIYFYTLGGAQPTNATLSTQRFIGDVVFSV